MHVYRWLNTQQARAGANPDDLRKLPEIKTKKGWTKKVQPGISTFASKPEAVGAQHLKELFDHAAEVIPDEDVEVTPLFLLATAGVRLLPDRQRQELLSNVCTYAKQNTRFLLPDCNLQIQAISGETEGLYGWIAANYLLGGFNDPYAHNHGKDHHTYGFLDLGGASAQIAFAPNGTEVEKHYDDLHTLQLRTLDGVGQEYQLFVTTWLGYGMNEARTRYTQDLLSSVDLEPQAEVPDPCLPAGMTKDIEQPVDLPKHADRPPHFVGTGEFSECLSRTYPMLDKEAACPDEPCLFHGVHVPAIDFDINHFVGVSEYWHTTHEIFQMGHKDRAYDFQTYQKRVLEFCSQDWVEIEHALEIHKWGDKIDKDKAGDVCFKASWLINMLHEGIGIPRVGMESSHHDHPNQNTTKALIDSAKQEGYLAPFQAVNKIDNTEVSWTLGKMILYASSMVPPADESVQAVGFGKNSPSDGSTSSKFEHAGGQPDTSLPLSEVSGSGHHSSTTEDYLSSSSDGQIHAGQNNDWREKLMHPPRRAPGVLFIILIALIAIILLCGRERRQTIYRKLFPWRRTPKSPYLNGSSASRRNGGLAQKLGLASRTGGSKYERVMEEGEMTNAVGDFELGALSASSSDTGSEGENGGSVRHSTNSRSSGRKRFATPRSGTMSPRKGIDTGTMSPRRGAFSPSASTVGLNAMRGGGYFEGVGLGLSVEGGRSRERLGAGGLSVETGGRRSRAVSPQRVRSPLMGPYKEAID